MSNEGHLVAQVELLEQSVEVALVLEEAVRAGPGVVELVRVAETDQIRNDAAPVADEERDDIAPQVGRGWVAVQKDDRVAFPAFMNAIRLPSTTRWLLVSGSLEIP